MNRNEKVLIVSLIALAFVLVPVLEVGAYSSAKVIQYPMGTVCGDAQAGAWSTPSFSGASSFFGASVTFTVSNMVITPSLTTTNKGTITASSGTVTATFNKREVVTATFPALTGTYKISGTSMNIKFKISSVTITTDTLFAFTGSIPGSVIPKLTIPCTTSDT